MKSGREWMRFLLRAEVLAVVLIAGAFFAYVSPRAITIHGGSYSVSGASEHRLIGGDADNGHTLYAQSCTGCHGQQGQGMPHQGLDLRASKFIGERSDAQLVGFLKVGRQPAENGTVRGLLMPPRGGNASLTDAELGDIVAFLREMQSQARLQSASVEPQ